MTATRDDCCEATTGISYGGLVSVLKKDSDSFPFLETLHGLINVYKEKTNETHIIVICGNFL